MYTFSSNIHNTMKSLLEAHRVMAVVRGWGASTFHINCKESIWMKEYSTLASNGWKKISAI